MKKTVHTSKIKLDYRSRKRMYGSATNDAWLSKFNEKEEEILLIKNLKAYFILNGQRSENIIRRIVSAIELK